MKSDVRRTSGQTCDLLAESGVSACCGTWASASLPEWRARYCGCRFGSCRLRVRISHNVSFESVTDLFDYF